MASLFRKLGAVIVDADAIAHDVLARPAVRRTLARAFGDDLIEGGRVNRASLAVRAFRSQTSVRRLNAITHPHIGREIRARVRRARGVVLIDAPLLQEAGLDAICDAVVFVDAPRRLREARAASRGWTRADLRRRERFQWTATRKRARAGYIVKNGGSLESTARQVQSIFRDVLISHK